jgi:hypothetical protein
MFQSRVQKSYCINPDPGLVFLLNPKSGCQTQFIGTEK